MKKLARILGHKTMLITVEAVMMVLMLAVIAAGLLLWRINQGPVEVAFARKYIESELSDPSHNLRMEVGRIFLEWSEIDARPQITLQNARLVNTQTSQLVLGVESVGVSLSRTGLFIGQIEPRTIIINRPLLTVVRGEDGGVRLALDQSSDDEKEFSVETEYVYEILDALTKPPREIDIDWPVRHLRMIMINEARLMVEDHVLQQSWLIPRMDLAFRRARGSLVATASLWLESAATAEPTLVTEAAYFGENRNIAIDARVSAIRAPFLASKFPNLTWLKNQNVILNGNAKAILGEGLKVSELEARLESPAGLISIPDLYDHTLPYKGMALKVGYSAEQKTLTVRDSHLAVNEDIVLDVSGNLVWKDDGSLQAPLRLHIESLPQSRVAELWPTTLKDDSAADWALNRLSKGRVFDTTINVALDAKKKEKTPVDITAPLNPGTEEELELEEQVSDEWTVNLDSMTVDFGIENMTVDYRAPMLPVRNGNGRGHYDYVKDQLVVNVESGMLGDMKIESGKVVIDTVYGEAVGHASIDANLNGPLKTVFQYITSEPIDVKKDIVSDISKISGNAALKLNIAMPTLAELPAEKITVTGTGTITSAFLPGIVNDLDVSSGDAIKVALKGGRIDVGGKGKLAGYDMNFTYAQYLHSAGKPWAAQITAGLNVDAGLRQKFGIDLADWMDGEAPVKVVYTEKPGGGQAEVNIDVDATPLTLFVKPMNYTKAPGIPSKATAKAFLKNGDLMEIRNLNVETPNAQVTNGTLAFTLSGDKTLLSSGVIPRARLDKTDVALNFKISPDNVVNLSAKGAYLDVTPFLENDKKGEPYSGPGLIASASADQMLTAPGRLVRNGKVYVSMDRQGDLQHLEFDAKAGAGNITFRYKPDASKTKMVLKIEAGDAGAALQSFAIYENVRGGKLSVTGESKPGADKKVVYGHGQMTDFKVVNAPALARLVNALSLPGMMELLGSDGISFTRLEADYVWARVRGGDMVTFKDGRTSGASMGLTFEGTVDRVQQTINVTGSIVPVSLVNDILGSIPILGDILSGGSEGGVFAATYSVRGPVKTPTTSVNPLSVLTPGILRRIFFEETP